MGYEACLQAKSSEVEEGSIGAGTGATIGKLMGVERATKGGIGTQSYKLKNGVVVGVLVVVNAFGDIVSPTSGEILAGVRDSKKGNEVPGENLKSPFWFFQADYLCRGSYSYTFFLCKF